MEVKREGAGGGAGGAGSGCGACLSAGRALQPLAAPHPLRALLEGLLRLEPGAELHTDIKEDRSAACVYICWECRATLHKTMQFKLRAGRAHQWLEWARTQSDDQPFVEVKALSTLKITEIKSAPDYEIDYERNRLFLPEVTGNDKYWVDIPVVPPKEKLHDVAMSDDDDYFGETLPLEVDETDVGVKVKDESDGQDAIHVNDDELESLPIDTSVSNLELDIKREDVDDFQISEYPVKHRKKRKSRAKGSLDKIKKRTTQLIRNYYTVSNSKPLGDDYYTVITVSEEEMWKNRDAIRSNSYYQLRQFRCESCVSSFTSESQKKSHDLKFHDKKAGRFVCEICKRRSLTEYIHKNHVRRHYEIFKCNECEYSTASGKHQRIYNHNRTYHKGGKLFMCRNCKEGFRSQGEFQQHWNTEHKYFYCAHCPKKYTTRERITFHLRSHDPFPCDVCHAVLRSKKALSAHRRSNHPPPRKESASKGDAYCVECDRTFSSNACFVQHVKIIHEPDWFPCTECDRRFKSERAREMHYKIEHLKITDFKCDICDKYLSKKGSLEQHMRFVHGGEKLPKNKFCTICGRGFTSNKCLTNHIRTHTGERPYKCELCDAAFAQRTPLQTHIKHIHLQIRRSKQ